MLDTVVLSLIFWNGVELIILNGKSRKWERVPAIVYNVIAYPTRRPYAVCRRPEAGKLSYKMWLYETTEGGL